MNSMLQRYCFESRRSECRRELIVFGLLLMASAGWYALRPSLIRQAAIQSVGYPGREALMSAALRQTGIRILEDGRSVTPGMKGHVFTHCLPRPGWVAWVFHSPDQMCLAFFDQHLCLQGRVKSESAMISMESPPGDMDGDGYWEIVFEYYPLPDEDPVVRDLRGWVVVRLGSSNNEIVWLGLIDANLWGNRGARVKPIWRDEDGDGLKELIFVTVETVRLPGRRIGFKPPRTVAVFEWDAPGSMLSPRSLPADCGVSSCELSPRGPVKVALDVELAPLLRRLHPIPEGFGQSATTTPASSPSTAPISLVP